MIKKTILGLVLVVSLGFGANFEDAKKAYNQGDYKTALSILEDLANKGDVEAQTYLGYMYNYGNGVQQDYKKAFELFEKASNQEMHKHKLFLDICMNMEKE